MSQNTQNPYFYTLDGSLPTNNLEVVGATSLNIYSAIDVTQVFNTETSQYIDLPANCVMELSPDRGNTLQTLQISPAGIAYVVMIGGTAQLI